MTNELTELLLFGMLAFAAGICLFALICYVAANIYEHYKLKRKVNND
jgi:hypothetical protein